MFTLLNLLVGTELWSAIPSNSRYELVSQICYAMLGHIPRPPTATVDDVLRDNIYLELDIILRHHTVDDYDEYERVIHKFFLCRTRSC